jgi:hypothetical protein
LKAGHQSVVSGAETKRFQHGFEHAAPHFEVLAQGAEVGHVGRKLGVAAQVDFESKI